MTYKTSHVRVMEVKSQSLDRSESDVRGVHKVRIFAIRALDGAASRPLEREAGTSAPQTNPANTESWDMLNVTGTVGYQDIPESDVREGGHEPLGTVPPDLAGYLAHDMSIAFGTTVKLAQQEIAELWMLAGRDLSVLEAAVLVASEAYVCGVDELPPLDYLWMGLRRKREMLLFDAYRILERTGFDTHDPSRAYARWLYQKVREQTTRYESDGWEDE